jgi:hypothetical protein
MVSLPDGIHIKSDTMTNLRALRQQALLPINQAATLKLRKIGIPTASDIQPVFQLMEWAIVSDKRKRYNDLAHELELLQTSPDQASALEYFFTNVPGGLKDVVRTVLHLDPRSAAKKLLELLDMRIKSDPKK